MRISFLFMYLFLFLFALPAFCQQPFTLKIRVPETFSLNRVSVSYSDGLTTKELGKEDLKREMVISSYGVSVSRNSI